MIDPGLDQANPDGGRRASEGISNVTLVRIMALLADLKTLTKNLEDSVSSWTPPDAQAMTHEDIKGIVPFKTQRATDIFLALAQFHGRSVSSEVLVSRFSDGTRLSKKSNHLLRVYLVEIRHALKVVDAEQTITCQRKVGYCYETASFNRLKEYIAARRRN